MLTSTKRTTTAQIFSKEGWTPMKRFEAATKNFDTHCTQQLLNIAYRLIRRYSIAIFLAAACQEILFSPASTQCKQSTKSMNNQNVQAKAETYLWTFFRSLELPQHIHIQRENPTHVCRLFTEASGAHAIPAYSNNDKLNELHHARWVLVVFWSSLLMNRLRGASFRCCA